MGIDAEPRVPPGSRGAERDRDDQFIIAPPYFVSMALNAAVLLALVVLILTQVVTTSLFDQIRVALGR